jgi:hypothetical protein
VLSIAASNERNQDLFALLSIGVALSPFPSPPINNQTVVLR